MPSGPDARRKVRRSSPVSHRFPAPLGWPVLVVIMTAFAFGGGGSQFGLLNLAVELVALVVMAWMVGEIRRGWGDLGVALRVLMCATLALPLVQLVPLPPAIWQGVPGAELATTSRGFIGTADGWYPLSLDPLRTAIAFAALLPALAVLLLMRQRSDAVQLALRLVVTLALINLMVGAMQVISGENHFLPYPLIKEGRLYGLFASHNSSGLFFVISLCALFAVDGFGPQAMRGRLATFAVGALLVVGTVLTQSRSSTALLAVPLFAFALRWFLNYRRDPQPIQWKVVLPTMVAVLALAAFAASSARFQANYARFEDLEDLRPAIWQDAWAAWQHFMPFGSGMGSFDEVFQNFESLETVTTAYVRRAHNDFLELGIEAGVFGYALLLGWVVWLIQAWRRGRSSQVFSEIDGAGLAVLVIAAQSALDYPLRNEALLSLAGLLIAVLAAGSTRLRDGVVE